MQQQQKSSKLCRGKGVYGSSVLYALFFCKPESALQRVCGQGSQNAGGSPGETFAAAHERASWRDLWCSGCNPCPLNDLWEPSLLLSQPLPTPSPVVHSRPPWWGGRVPFGTFSSTGDHRPRSSLLALRHAVPGKEWCGQSQAIPLLHTPMRSNFFFFQSKVSKINSKLLGMKKKIQLPNQWS